MTNKYRSFTTNTTKYKFMKELSASELAKIKIRKNTLEAEARDYINSMAPNARKVVDRIINNGDFDCIEMHEG